MDHFASEKAENKDPDLSHLSRQDYEHIYEPAEDSFLLMDALWKDRTMLNSVAITAPLLLEIGSGSGIISTYLHTAVLPLQECISYATDINPKAAAATTGTFTRNAVRGEVILMNLSSAFRLTKLKFDILIFNPPYVPSESEEMDGEGLSRSWAGGKHGREVLETFFPEIGNVLSATGVFYLVALESNDVPYIRNHLKKIANLNSAIALQRKAGIEWLYILRFWREECEKWNAYVEEEAVCEAAALEAKRKQEAQDMERIALLRQKMKADEACAAAAGDKEGEAEEDERNAFSAMFD